MTIQTEVILNWHNLYCYTDNYDRCPFPPTDAHLPTGLSAVKLNLTSFRVSWTPTATVTGYQVYWSGGGGMVSGNMSVGAEVTAITITDLTPGLIYDISLVALSRYLPSPVVPDTVPLGEPSIPALVVCLTGR